MVRVLTTQQTVVQARAPVLLVEVSKLSFVLRLDLTSVRMVLVSLLLTIVLHSSLVLVEHDAWTVLAQIHVLRIFTVHLEALPYVLMVPAGGCNENAELLWV
jgi:hypothetical protein